MAKVLTFFKVSCNLFQLNSSEKPDHEHFNRSSAYPNCFRTMAFQKEKFARFYELIKATKNSHLEVRGVAENFILEERLTAAREDGYGEYVATSIDVGNWQMEHENYLAEKINISQGN